MLPKMGAVDLYGSVSPTVAYLTLEAASPVTWPSYFGVLTKPGASASSFDLQMLYNPPSGVGVAVPVLVEEFPGLTLATAADDVNGSSEFITVESFAQTADASLAAYDLMNFDPSQAVPAIGLTGTLDGVSQTWTPKLDLLESTESAPDFVVEVDTDGTATLRFGDTVNGKTPDTGTSFVAHYRIGNGTAGNVGADSLVYLAAADARIQTCRNPLPATGGTDPETNDQIRRRAPEAFLTQERAVTMADYEAVAAKNPQVDRSVASLRWTGSWYTVFIAVEPQGGGLLTPTLQGTLKAAEERYRLAGQDLGLDSPQYVSLEIELQICVDPNYFMSYVEQSLLQVLSNRILPNGQKGLFYADNFSFGQTVYLSPVYAAVRSVAGVVAVTATTFQPQGVNSTQYLAAGEIKVGPLQVARLDNDPNYPDHGQLTLLLEGGKWYELLRKHEFYLRLLRGHECADPADGEQPAGTILTVLPGGDLGHLQGIHAGAALQLGLSGAGELEDAGQRRFHGRLSGCHFHGAGHSDVLPGTPGQRKLPAHGGTTAIADRTVEAEALAAIAGRVGFDLCGLYAQRYNGPSRQSIEPRHHHSPTDADAKRPRAGANATDL